MTAALAPVIPIRPPQPLTVVLRESPRKRGASGGYSVAVSRDGWNAKIVWKHDRAEAIALAVELAAVSPRVAVVMRHQLAQAFAMTLGKFATISLPREVIEAIEGGEMPLPREVG